MDSIARRLIATDESAPILCARCVRQLTPGNGDFFEVQIEAAADPTPPTFTVEDLADKVRPDWQALIANLSKHSERELVDQVYRRMVIHLCATCFEAWFEDPAR